MRYILIAYAPISKCWLAFDTWTWQFVDYKPGEE